MGNCENKEGERPEFTAHFQALPSKGPHLSKRALGSPNHQNLQIQADKNNLSLPYGAHEKEVKSSALVQHHDNDSIVAFSPTTGTMKMKKPSNLTILIDDEHAKIAHKQYLSPPRKGSSAVKIADKANIKPGKPIEHEHPEESYLYSPVPNEGISFNSSAAAFIRIEEILFAGPLLKYKPGLHFNWIERWCVITRKEFKYYKNEWVAKCPDLKPLMTLPIYNMVGTYRISLSSTRSHNKIDIFKSDQKSYSDLYLFEIFSGNGDYPYQEDFVQHQPANDSHHIKKVDIENNEGYKLWANYEEENRKLRHSPKKVQKGCLMRSPVGNESRTSLHRRNGSQSGSVSRRGSPLRSPKGIPSRMSPIKKNDEDNPLIEKLNNRLANPRDSLISWSGREKEWYFSERRLLFATPSIEERERWTEILNYITHENYVEVKNPPESHRKAFDVTSSFLASPILPGKAGF